MSKEEKDILPWYIWLLIMVLAGAGAQLIVKIIAKILE